MTEWEAQWALFSTKPLFNWRRFKNSNDNYLKVSENCFKDIQKMKKYSFKKSTKSQAVTFELWPALPPTSFQLLRCSSQASTAKKMDALSLPRSPTWGCSLTLAGKRAGYSHFSSLPAPCCNSSIPGSCDQETNQCAETITRSLITASD